MDGWLTIGTKIDDSGFKNQLEELEDETNSKAIDITDQVQKEVNEMFKQIAQDYGEETANLVKRTSEILEEFRGLTADKEIISSDDIKNIEILRKEMESINNQLQKTIGTKFYIKGLNDFKKETLDINAKLKDVGNSIMGVIKKIGKWSLALLGIRAMYGFIRNAVNQVAQEDQTLQTQIQYINYAIGTALKPVLEFVLNIIYKIIAGIGAIIKLITGVNIFAKATADNFVRANSGASALKKTLAGFDEMNIIGGGGTGLLGDINADIGNLRDLASEVEKTTSKIKEWFTKPLPTREELEGNAEIYKNAWIKVGNFLGLGVIFNEFKQRLNELKEQLKPIWQPVIDSFNETISRIKILLKPFTDYLDEHFIKPIRDKFSNWKEDFLKKYAKFINKLIYGANMFLQYFGIQIDYIDEESALTGKDIEKNIGGALDKTMKKAEEAYKPFDTLYGKLKELTNKTWNIVTNFVISGKDKLNQQLNPLRQSLASIGIKLPYLAKGGIINMPSRGVPVGGAIAGERGMEGVIPLTDSQQMAMLGEAIGKYISMNATVPVYIGNRLVLREMKRIEAEENFAYNR